MKKINHILPAILITLGMLAAAPVITARADCVELPADTWTCTGADTDGMDAGANSDTVTVAPGATVDDSTGPGTGIVISMTDGTLTNNGDVTATDSFEVAIMANGNAFVTNNGDVSADDDYSTGIFTDSGNVENNGTVSADGTFGTGVYALNGNVLNNDTISAVGDIGTGIFTGDGANTVTNNGNIFATNADGIAIVTGSGNDTVTLNSGSVTSGGVSSSDSLTYAICTCDGDDQVVIEDGATINGIIDGGADNDILGFSFFTQGELDLMGLLASGGNLTYNGQTYTWLNFETLKGLIASTSTSGEGGKGKRHRNVPSGPRVFFNTETALGVESDDLLGINVFAKPGLIAFIPFAALGSIDFGGEGVRFQVPNSDDWFVMVVNLGPFEAKPSHDWYQVSIFDENGTLVSDQQWFDF